MKKKNYLFCILCIQRWNMLFFCRSSCLTFDFLKGKFWNLWYVSTALVPVGCRHKDIPQTWCAQSHLIFIQFNFLAFFLTLSLPSCNVNESRSRCFWPKFDPAGQVSSRLSLPDQWWMKIKKIFSKSLFCLLLSNLGWGTFFSVYSHW